MLKDHTSFGENVRKQNESLEKTFGDKFCRSGGLASLQDGFQ